MTTTSKERHLLWGGSATTSHDLDATSEERRLLWAASATTFHDLDTILAAVRQTCVDRTTLREEGRATALAGADALLGAYVRRACATAAASCDMAARKTAVLASVRQVYGGHGPADRLMRAIVDAAMAAEADAWPVAASRH